jgi:hypothetical protein
MAYQKLQASDALSVVPSDTIPIPQGGGVQQSGTAAAPTGAQLVGIGTSFLSSVKVGNIVYDSTNGVIATVSAVVSDTVLTTSAAIATGATYEIYAYPETNGCVLYVGVAGNLRVKMASGKVATFIGIQVGFIPLQVTQVYSTGTTATDIVALW